MNPGYISLILYSITAILLLTGWFVEYIDRLDRKAIAGVMILWPLLVRYDLQLWSTFYMNAALILLSLGTVWLWMNIPAELKLSAFTLGVLNGSIVFLFHELVRIDPILIMISPSVDIALVMTIIVLLAFRSVRARLFSATFGFILGEILIAAALMRWLTPPIALGEASFYDAWWIAVVGIVSTSYIWRSIGSGVRPLIWRKKGVGDR